MSNLKLQVLCENKEIKFFDSGIIGAYFYIGLPDEWSQEPEYTISVFFNNNMEFEGILLLDTYKDLLNREADSLLSTISRNIEEYERLNLVKFNNDFLVTQNYDLCKCSHCGKLTDWEDGNIWECEMCGKLICSTCVENYNKEAQEISVSNLDFILCESCFA